MKKLVLLSMLVGCGVDSTQYVDVGEELKNGIDYVSEQGGQAKDHLGKKANESRKHLSDRDINSEEVDKKSTATSNNLGSKANATRKNMSDNGFSSEEVGYEISTGDDVVGAESNRARKRAYESGIEEMRYGDQTTTDNVASNESRLTDAEARLKLIEQINDLQNSMLDVQSDRLDALEANDVVLLAEIGSNKEDQEKINEIQASINNMFSSELSNLFDSLTILTDRVTTTEGNVAAQGVLISNLQSNLTNLKQKVKRIKRKLLRKIRRNKNDIDELQQDMYGCQGIISGINASIAMNESNIIDLQNDVDEVCSVQMNSVVITDRHWYHTHTTTVQIPTVTCP